MNEIFKLYKLQQPNLSYKHFTLGVEEEYMVIDPLQGN